MKKLIKLYFQTLSFISPSLAAGQAFNLFQIPINKKIRTKEQAFFDSVDSFDINWEIENIQCYELGPKDGSLVIMVHGWESNAASMSGIAKELAVAGHRTVLFNLPAHGFSKLKRTNLKMCQEALLTVLQHLDPQMPFSVVSHSFGSAVTSYALAKSSYQVDHLVFLTTPNKIEDVFLEFANFIGLSTKAHHKTLHMAEAILQEPISNLTVAHLGQFINSKNLLIIHDKTDKVISQEKSIAVSQAWLDSKLDLIDKTGHYRMLWDKNVIQKVSNQLTASQTINTQKELIP
ncbi:alpha/beta hydrolase [Reichenbachiella agarivorans]|uniref:Alpha/beta hydrolase n=1 Tax=Reichenbachiella agarivorans TaxID=2979464 RepID=A0ABY6CNY7_9BACT|nr:alpha/beta hydrolase [Reichenbachiella agarivorans]UXP32226.1 alpha/beta hydrolase [Reichenbachiella agarivorans]